MARVPDTPCGECGRLLYKARGSRPVPVCQPCRAKLRAARAAARVGVRPSRVECICPMCCLPFTRKPSHAQTWCSKSCAGLARRMSSNPVTRLDWAQCDQCGRPFIRRRGTLRCSDQCRNQASRAAAAKYVDSAANSERIMRLYRLAVAQLEIPKASMWRRTLTDHLARRDGPICGICNNPVDLDLPSGPRGNRMGPSIDHVIPVSHGGDDTLTNLRLTHWTCNHKRGNRGGNEQLRLIA